MRRILAASACALLALGVAPSAAVATDSGPTESPTGSPTGSPTATPTQTPTGSPTQVPTGSPTEVPTEGPTASPTATAPGDSGGWEGEAPGGDVLAGTLTLDPTYGKPGSTTTIASDTPCVDEDGKVGPTVEVVVLSPADLDALESSDADITPTYDEVLATDEDGGWSTEFTVPTSAKDGDAYVALAACFASEELDETSEPFLIYDEEVFTVTDAAVAPPAEPVPGNPSYTG